jgi:DNA polymerase III subunit alpha
VRIEEGVNPKLTAQRNHAAGRCQGSIAAFLRIRIPLESANESTVDDLHTLFRSAKARRKCCLTWNAQGDFMVVMEAEGYNVLPDRNFMARVEELCGRARQCAGDRSGYSTEFLLSMVEAMWAARNGDGRKMDAQR